MIAPVLSGSAQRRAPAPPPQPPSARANLLARPLASYYLVLGSTALLLVIGLLMVLSASSVTSYADTGSSFSVFARQALWVTLGLPVFWVGLRLPVRAYRWLGYPLLLFAGVGLLAVLVPGIGTDVAGGRRWIALPGAAQLQPSEFAKLALALWGADLLVRKRKLLGDWRHLLLPLVPVAGLFAGLVMLEPDLGTTLVLLTIVLTLLWTVGTPGRIFAGLLGVVASLVTLVAVIEPYRLARLTSFLHPFKDPQGAGFQAVQGIYALSSGGWWGVGLGASRQKWAYLPNANTDYIFAILGEELGLIGTLLVLALFATLAYAGIRIARRSAEPFARLAAAAVTMWILGQAVINIGAVVGLLPITGIPLPLISFGGSALLPILFSLGMLASFARAEPGAAAALAGRPRLRRRIVALIRSRPSGVAALD